MFFVGDHYCGKCDRVPGLFHVKTRFLHINWFPLVPRDSYLIMEQGGGREGVRIPMSFRSVLLAWVRAILVVTSIYMVVGWVMFGPEIVKTMLSPNPPVNGIGRFGREAQLAPIHKGVILIASTVALFAFLFLAFRTHRASARRAHALGKHVGIPPSDIVKALGEEGLPQNAYDDFP